MTSSLHETFRQAIETACRTEQALEEVRQRRDAERAAIEAGMLALEQEYQGARLLHESAKSSVRELGALWHADTHEKALPGGVRVRVVEQLAYDPHRAYHWSLDHKMGLALDVKGFEAVAKATPLEFVTYQRLPQVTLPTSFRSHQEASE